MTESASREIELTNAPTTDEDQNTQKEASTSGGTEDKNDELVIEIGNMLELPDIESTKSCHIHKVPHHLRKWKKEAYTPQVVSIGPFHHKNKRFKVIEEHKERYFRSFMKRSKIKSEYLVDNIRKMEKRIRGCYEEIIDLSSDRFVKMILVDASFILELFIREAPGIQTRDDPMFVKPRAEAIKLDLLLLENQLPFFVIEELLQLTFQSLCMSDPRLSRLFNCYGLLELSLNYFSDPCFEFKCECPDVEIEHFTDLLRTFQIPPPMKRPNRVFQETDLNFTATQLQEAGVKFEGVKEGYECRFDIKFEKGVLKIPKFELNDRTEVATRNIMALEQTRYIDDKYFTDHLFLMDSLINTREDVDLLCKEGILVNYLGDNNAAMSLINNLNKGIVWQRTRDDYNVLYKELNSFYAVPWHNWKATLNREYFSTPWRTASTVAAIMLLVLTFIQTVCSIIKEHGFKGYIIWMAFPCSMELIWPM